MARSMKERLEARIAAQDYIRLKIKNSGNETTDCIPIAVSERVLLVLRYYDFSPDGYLLCPLANVKSCRHNKMERYFGSIVKAEGSQALLDTCPRLSLDSCEKLAKDLQKLGHCVGLGLDDGSVMHLGRIISVFPDHIDLHSFSPLGEWEAENWEEFYKDISYIEFETAYIKTFEKYLPEETWHKKKR